MVGYKNYHLVFGEKGHISIFRENNLGKDIYQQWFLSMVMDVLCSFAHVYVLNFYNFLKNKNR